MRGSGGKAKDFRVFAFSRGADGNDFEAEVSDVAAFVRRLHVNATLRNRRRLIIRFLVSHSPLRPINRVLEARCRSSLTLLREQRRSS